MINAERTENAEDCGRPRKRGAGWRRDLDHKRPLRSFRRL